MKERKTLTDPLEIVMFWINTAKAHGMTTNTISGLKGIKTPFILMYEDINVN